MKSYMVRYDGEDSSPVIVCATGALDAAALFVNITESNRAYAHGSDHETPEEIGVIVDDFGVLYIKVSEAMLGYWETSNLLRELAELRPLVDEIAQLEDQVFKMAGVIEYLESKLLK